MPVEGEVFESFCLRRKRRSSTVEFPGVFNNVALHLPQDLQTPGVNVSGAAVPQSADSTPRATPTISPCQ